LNFEFLGEVCSSRPIIKIGPLKNKPEILIARVDSRIHLPVGLHRDVVNALKAQFRHMNPEWSKKKYLGVSMFGVEQTIKTHRDHEEDGVKWMSIPRGGAERLRATCRDFGIALKFSDNRTVAPVHFPKFQVDPSRPEMALRVYQWEAVEAAKKFHQGIVRAPTGAGKTSAALATIAELGQRAIVIMRDSNLLKQWLSVSSKCLGIPKSEIGVVMGGKIRQGKRLTLALQQTLYRKGDKLKEILQSEPYGAVIVDEVQSCAAETFHKVIDAFPCKYRIGFSADETRRDKKEFLIYDMFSQPIYEIGQSYLEDLGVVHSVTIRVVETEFDNPEYRAASGEERNFTSLMAEIVEDENRNDLVMRLVRDLLAREEVPILLFTHRREHAERLSRDISEAFGISVGLLRGGSSKGDSGRYAESLEGLKRGIFKVAVGTFHSVGTGIDIPLIRSGVCVTPISEKNKQFFNQVRGRICRTVEGKSAATLYVLWDRLIFPDYTKILKKWNRGNVEVFDGSKWKVDHSVR
jgi:superfamily II DNA or RNA helicase